MTILKNVVGVILLIMGALWALQGANIVGGSAMTGQSQWLIIGIIVALLGLGVLYWANMRRLR